MRLTPLPAPLPDVETLPALTVRHVVADAPDAYPCRRCLRDAAPGDTLVLLPYDPFLGDSPYRQPGPVYVHAAACAPDDDLGAALDAGRVPRQLARRRLSVRAFDADHLMRGTALADGADLVEVATTLLADEDVAYLHVHNAGPGCFAVRVDR